ncbi:MAG: HD domain-containing phosphohydrolase, partial [Vicinamibacterales bacterium]
VPDAILLKIGKLTAAEFEVVKTHTVIGARILSGGKFPLLRLAEEIAFSHHERWDGDGYARMRGIDIPLAGRIVAVADVFDALTQQRPYKPAWPVAQAIAEIDLQRGRQFDPEVVGAFLRVVENSPREAS